MMKYYFEFEDVSERQKQYIISLLEARTPVKDICKALPYKYAVSKKIVEKMGSMGLVAIKRKSDITRNNIIKLFREEKSIQEISKELGCCERTVTNYLKQCGLMPCRMKHTYTKAKTTKSERTNLIVNEIQKNHLSLSEIGRKYGVSRQYVFYLKDKYLDKNNEE